MSVQAVRLGLRDALRAEFDWQCTGYEMAKPTPPCFEVGFSADGGIVFNQAMNRGVEIYNMVVRAIVATTVDQRSQELIDSMCAPSGTGSVRDAIEADPTLGGACANLAVTGVSNYRAFAVAALPNVTFLAAEWAVTVYI